MPDDTRHIGRPISGSGSKIRAGLDAVIETLARLHEHVICCSETLSNGVGVDLASYRTVTRIDRADRAVSLGIGLAACGKSVGLLLDSSDLLGVRENVVEAASKNLPLTLVLSDPLRTDADPAQGFGSGIAVVMRSACPAFNASTLQEGVDLTILAATLSRAILCPSIVLINGRSDLWSLQEVVLSDLQLEPDLSALSMGYYRSSLFGSSGIDARSNQASKNDLSTDPPTWNWLDPSNAVELGGSLSDKLAIKRLAGRRAFVQRDLQLLIDQLFESFRAQTGRFYAPVQSRDATGGAATLIGTGSIVPHLIHACEQHKIDHHPVHVAGITQLWPFPAEQLVKTVDASMPVCVMASGREIDGSRILLRNEVAAALLQLRERSTGLRKKGRRRASASEPRLMTLIHPNEWRPTVAEIAEIVKRGQTVGASSVLVAGCSLDAAGIRHPEIERTVQSVRAAGFDFSALELRSGEMTEAVGSSGLRIVTNSAAQTWRLIRLFATVLNESGVSEVSGRFYADSDATGHPVIGSLSWAGVEDHAPAMLAVGRQLFGSLSVREATPENATVILTDDTALRGIGEIPPLFPSWFRSKNSLIRSIDTSKLELSAVPAEMLSDWALLAAAVNWLPVLEEFDFSTLERVPRAHSFVPADFEQFIKAVAKVTTTVEEASIESMKGRPPEPEAPREVVESTTRSRPVSDLQRFWQTSGILYREGRLYESPVDPFLASGAVPARSGSLTQQLAGIKPIPNPIPENCTACGSCWTVCPESAFSAISFSIEELFDAALHAATASQGAFLQLPRLRTPLVKSMHRIAAQDDLHLHPTAGDLLTEAGQQIIEKSDFDDTQVEQITTELASLATYMSSLRPIRTARYFDRFESETRGSGHFLGLTIDPFACTGCSLCISSCEDDALEQVTTLEAINRVHTEWHDLADLRLTGATWRKDAEKDAIFDHPRHLLGASSERPFRGGGADVGNLNRSALRIFLEGNQIHALDRQQQLIDELTKAIELIDHHLQDQVKRAVEINDFEAFAKSLTTPSEINSEPDNQSLITLASGHSHQSIEDSNTPARELARLRQYFSTWIGRLRTEEAECQPSHMILVYAMSERSFGLAGYPINPFSMPAISVSSSGAADVTLGVAKAVKEDYSTLLQAIRRSQLLIEGLLDVESDREIHDTIIDELEAKTLSLMPLILLATDTFGTEELHVLSGEAPINLLLLSGGFSLADGSTRPWYNSQLALAVNKAFVLQTPLSDPVALLEGVSEAAAFDGPSLVHVYAPDPTRDGLQPEAALSLAALALEARVFPYLKRVPGNGLELNPIAEATTPHRSPADWMFAQKRFSDLFQFSPRRDWSSDQLSMAEWMRHGLALDGDQDIYVESKTDKGNVSRHIASRKVLEFAKSCEQVWRILELMVPSTASPLQPSERNGEAKAMDLPRLEVPNDLEAAHKQLTDRLLQLSRIHEFASPGADTVEEKPSKDSQPAGES